MTEFPKTIQFISDDTEAEFVSEILNSKLKERVANYKYTKAKANNGLTFSMFLSQINGLYKDKLILCP